MDYPPKSTRFGVSKFINALAVPMRKSLSMKLVTRGLPLAGKDGDFITNSRAKDIIAVLKTN